MKSKIVLLSILLLALFSQKSKGQDLITFFNGDEIKSKVIELTPSEVKYKKFDNLEGPIYTSLKSEILMIKYQNGNKDVFKDYLLVNQSSDDKIENKVSESESISSSSYSKGYQDAQSMYRNHTGAGAATLITTLTVGGILGLIPAVACSSTPPSPENLGVSSNGNPDYMNGYRDGAKKKKSRKVWTNYGIACLTNAVVFFAVVLGSAN
jgi:hypothetical protein